MTYIKVNITEISDCIEQYGKYKNDCYDSILTNYALLENSDSCWVDQAGIDFREIIKKDRLKIVDYFDNLDLMCKELKSFNDDLMSILSKAGYSKQKKMIFEFDDSRISSCNSYLNSAKSYLNSAIYIINYYLLSSNYENKNIFYNMRSNLYSAINTIDTIKSNINKFDRSVSNAVTTHSSSIKKVNGLDIDVKNVEYAGNIVNLTQN